MSAYRLSVQAVDDIEVISDRIANDNPAAAKRVTKAFQQTFRFLATHRSVGQARDELLPGLRAFPASKPANSYVVLFRLQPDHVEILMVVHGARDWPALFRRADFG